MRGWGEVRQKCSQVVNWSSGQVVSSQASHTLPFLCLGWAIPSVKEACGVRAEVRGALLLSADYYLVLTTTDYLLTWGRTWRSSPTAASRAAATDSASDTSRPRLWWRPHLALLLLE